MSGGILCKGVVLKVHRVINYNSMYIIIGYDINTPLMTMYEIMTLCKHRMTATVIVQSSPLCVHVLIILTWCPRSQGGDCVRFYERRDDAVHAEFLPQPTAPQCRSHPLKVEHKSSSTSTTPLTWYASNSRSTLVLNMHQEKNIVQKYAKYAKYAK